MSAPLLFTSDSVGGLSTTKASSTLADNQSSSATIASFSKSTVKGLFITYNLQRGTGNAKTGFLLVSSDGTSVSYFDQGSELGTAGVTFTASISGTNIIWQYTSTSTGTAPTLIYEAKLLQ